MKPIYDILDQYYITSANGKRKYQSYMIDYNGVIYDGKLRLKFKQVRWTTTWPVYEVEIYIGGEKLPYIHTYEIKQGGLKHKTHMKHIRAQLISSYNWNYTEPLAVEQTAVEAI